MSGRDKMFEEAFGDNPLTKTLDFLADYPRYDYTITEISKQSNVSKPTIYKMLPILLEKKLIIKTREMGQSSYYQINRANKLVKAIIKFDMEIAKAIAEIEEARARLNDTVIIKRYEPVLTGSKSRVVAT